MIGPMEKTSPIERPSISGRENHRSQAGDRSDVVDHECAAKRDRQVQELIQRKKLRTLQFHQEFDHPHEEERDDRHHPRQT